jgi:hypothetical protein
MAAVVSVLRERWYTADFDQLDWRDVHVHGFRIVEGEHGVAELQLDIDFLLARPADAGAGGSHVVAQAMLQFHEVFGLRFTLDYVACSAGMSAFSIGTVERRPLREREDAADSDDHGPWRWRIELGWPEGVLEFEASGFSQWLVGEPVEQVAPTLAPAQRS